MKKLRTDLMTVFCFDVSKVLNILEDGLSIRQVGRRAKITDNTAVKIIQKLQRANLVGVTKKNGREFGISLSTRMQQVVAEWKMFKKELEGGKSNENKNRFM